MLCWYKYTNTDASRKAEREETVRRTAEEEGLCGADALRLRGNDLFKNKAYTDARVEYSKALDVVALVLEGQQVQHERVAVEMSEEARSLMVKCLANRAECNILLANFDAALVDVRAARQVDWRGMPGELADKLGSREERARNGLRASTNLGGGGASVSQPSANGVAGGNRSGDRGVDEEAAPQKESRKKRKEKKHVIVGSGGAEGGTAAQAGAVTGGEECVKGGDSAGTEAGVQAGGQEEEEDVCCVCLEVQSARRQFQKLSCCAYLIHTQCLEEWRRTCDEKKFPFSCPTCQQKM